jgi:hypothetical protein
MSEPDRHGQHRTNGRQAHERSAASSLLPIDAARVASRLDQQRTPTARGAWFRGRTVIDHRRILATLSSRSQTAVRPSDLLVSFWLSSALLERDDTTDTTNIPANVAEKFMQVLTVPDGRPPANWTKFRFLSIAQPSQSSLSWAIVAG